MFKKGKPKKGSIGKYEKKKKCAEKKGYKKYEEVESSKKPHSTQAKGAGANDTKFPTPECIFGIFCSGKPSMPRMPGVCEGRIKKDDKKKED